MAPSTEGSSTLLETNLRVHALLDERFLVFLEHVTALELEAAARAFESFRDLLEQHLRYEDREVFPVVARLHELHGDPQDQLPRQLEGDHVILERMLKKNERALLELQALEPLTRRAMVLALDTFLLLRRVLEHHDLREVRFAYPLLDAHLVGEERSRLLAGLDAAPQDP